MSKPRKLSNGSEKTIVFNFFNFFNFLNFLASFTSLSYETYVNYRLLVHFSLIVSLVFHWKMVSLQTKQEKPKKK